MALLCIKWNSVYNARYSLYGSNSRLGFGFVGVCFYMCITGDFGAHLQHHDTGASTGAEKGGCQCKYLLVSGPGGEERGGEGKGEGRREREGGGVNRGDRW